MNRKVRLQALDLISKQANEGLIKEAQVLESVIGFLKDVFKGFFDSIQSMWNPNSPILSVLEFLAVGAITARSKVLGILITVLGLFLGINVDSVFNTMKNLLTPYLSTEEGKRELNNNTDAVLGNIATTAVTPELRDSDEEIDKKIQEGVSALNSNASYSQLTNQINKFGIDSPGIEKIAKFSLGSMLPNLFGVFGKGKKGIVGIFFWILKTLLLGAGVIGATGAAASIVGVKPTGVKKEQPGQLTTPAVVAPPVSQIGSNLLKELRLVSNSSVTATRANTAPDSLMDESRNGLTEWVVDNPTGNFADVLYDWTLASYMNLGDVFRSKNITSNQLKDASTKVARSFQNANKSMSDYVIRIPQRYKNVKSVVEDVIKSIQ
ncbi:MAG TPA: hypothetical protein VMX17_03285 [Candidatus Glassbacteria bacterium]|nr:hypothetical protein [Candidatus Glassbacteria bacterium]